jgi:hypothetical protein
MSFKIGAGSADCMCKEDSHVYGSSDYMVHICRLEWKMFPKFQRYLEDSDWEEYSSRGDSYLEIVYTGVIILSVVVAGLCLFPQYVPW